MKLISSPKIVDGMNRKSRETLSTYLEILTAREVVEMLQAALTNHQQSSPRPNPGLFLVRGGGGK